MFPIQPPVLPAFFSFEKKQVSEPIPKFFKSFFLSWEDALWHLLEINKIKKNALILVPEFFCGDVIDNMQAHGLQYKTYAVDKFLRPNVTDFIQKLQEEKPTVVVIFHAVGITNPLLKNLEKWLNFLTRETILIEDCVHRVVDPKTIKFISSKHYIIDSLRKVVPVQGSWIYSQNKIAKVALKTNIQTSWYRFQVFFWWVLMQLFLIIVYYSKNEKIQKYGNKYAEFAMQQGYDVIGDHQLSACGIPGMEWLSSNLNYKKIYENKVQQVQLYNKLLEPIFEQKLIQQDQFFFEVPFPESDYSQLRGFPLGIELEFAHQFLEYVRSQNLLLRFELDDSEWSKKQKIVYLPMGLHVTQKDIEWICEVITGYNN